MTLSGKYSKEETVKHAVLKFLCFVICKQRGHKAEIEFEAGPGIGIFDCVDWDEGIVYEPICGKNKKIYKSKIERYLRYAGIRDIIFINTKDFKMTESVQEWVTKLETKM